MKDMRFYLEYETRAKKKKATVKNPGKHEGAVLAVLLGTEQLTAYGWIIECIGSLYNEPNSAVCGTSAAVSYIQEQCKRIPESLAREIHPKLFEYLDG